MNMDDRQGGTNDFETAHEPPYSNSLFRPLYVFSTYFHLWIAVCETADECVATSVVRDTGKLPVS